MLIDFQRFMITDYGNEQSHMRDPNCDSPSDCLRLAGPAMGDIVRISLHRRALE